ncbi:uncharacterized protein [Rutidosis leptorrhynchoides]|uniref:uncharacterized protein n=1 Tax=Rutidosis leptorrhynchoides TaxID=125765 RepID=UPI003A9A1FF8
MKCMGFGCKWRKWIHACLSSASISILINGSPTKEFSLERGVRQCDPLSPFLFILAAEGLNLLVKAALDKGLFKGVEVGADKVLVSHLQYVDDTIFFGEWSRSNALNLRNLLKCFELASGLKVNFQKSCVYGVGVDHSEVNLVANYLGCQVGKFPFTYLGLPIGSKKKKVKDWGPVIDYLGCQVGKFPFTYLGLPIGSKMKKVKDWGPVIDKFNARLSGWKTRSLSFGGRLVLIKAVLTSLPLFLLGTRFSKLLVMVILPCFGKVWIGGDKLFNLYPRLSRLETNKYALVKDRVSSENRGASWSWSQVPSGQTLGELQSLSSLLSSVTLNSSTRDKWHWRLASNGIFTVKRLSNLIDDQLPVRVELDKRGVDLHSVRCPLCDDGLESVDHSFIFCKHAQDIWDRVYKWWGVGNFASFDLIDLLDNKGPHSMSSYGKKKLLSSKMGKHVFNLEESEQYGVPRKTLKYPGCTKRDSN